MSNTYSTLLYKTLCTKVQVSRQDNNSQTIRLLPARLAPAMTSAIAGLPVTIETALLWSGWAMIITSNYLLPVPQVPYPFGPVLCRQTAAHKAHALRQAA